MQKQYHIQLRGITAEQAAILQSLQQCADRDAQQQWLDSQTEHTQQQAAVVAEIIALEIIDLIVEEHRDYSDALAVLDRY